MKPICAKKMKNPFKVYEDLPDTDESYKAWMIGFFQCALIFLLIGMPELLLAGQLREVAELSYAWFAIMGSMIGWPVIFLFTQRYWFALSFNFGLMMHKEDRRAAKKKSASCNPNQSSKEESKHE